MREERYHIALDKYDKNIVINALKTLRTRQLQEERPTECRFVKHIGQRTLLGRASGGAS